MEYSKVCDRCRRIFNDNLEMEIDEPLPAENPSLPTRLLDLGETNPKEVAARIRLVTCNTLNLSTKYAALSHSWDGKTSPELTTHNIDHLKSGIPQESSCQTFLNAVYVARQFDILYL